MPTAITNLITTEIKQQIKQLEQDRVVKIKQIEAKTEQAHQKKAAQLLVDLDHKLKLKEQQFEVASQREINKAITSKKEEIINQIFDQALLKLETLTPEQQLKILNKQLTGLDLKSFKVSCSPNWQQTAQKLLPQAEIKVDLAESGLLLESDTITIDGKLSTLLNQQKPDLLIKLNSLLFG